MPILKLCPFLEDDKKTISKNFISKVEYQENFEVLYIHFPFPTPSGNNYVRVKGVSFDVFEKFLSKIEKDRADKTCKLILAELLEEVCASNEKCLNLELEKEIFNWL
ncbi:hypothetical protein [Desulfovibrio sp. DV]|uniref:hypothetical protein n=1 Tax=Desulfovibrio sp. DV TaxID=1844708 RepID=UPI0011151C0E|nr:hypothetical protein [Desulfovibrio sp. DV]